MRRAATYHAYADAPKSDHPFGRLLATDVNGPQGTRFSASNLERSAAL